MKALSIGFGILTAAYALLIIAFSLGLPEEAGVAAICTCLLASGALTTKVTKKNGIKGNGISFALMIVCYMIFKSKDYPDWVIELFILIALHFALAFGWQIGAVWRKNKTEPAGASNGVPPR